MLWAFWKSIFPLHPPGFVDSDFLLSGENCSAGHAHSDWSKGWLIGRAFGTIAIEVAGSPELLSRCLTGWDENSLADKQFVQVTSLCDLVTIFTMLLMILCSLQEVPCAMTLVSLYVDVRSISVVRTTWCCTNPKGHGRPWNVLK